MINIAIADDHPMVISGLKNMLQPYAHINIIDIYQSGTALLDGLRLRIPDILLLDIVLPDLKGYELAGIITEQYPSIRILCITSLDAPSSVKAMMRNGSKGYLLKNADLDTLLLAIETVYNGGEYIEPVIKEQMLQNMFRYKEKETPQTEHKKTSLTRREQEILKLIVQELSNQEIAEKLVVSLRTIENHRYNLQQKLNIKNTVGLVKVAIEMGLV